MTVRAPRGVERVLRVLCWLLGSALFVVIYALSWQLVV